MTDNTDEIEGIFESMVRAGLLSTGNGWLEMAIEQKNPRVTLDLAQSEIMVYDLLDQFFVSRDLN
jgi:hypothetical protein